MASTIHPLPSRPGQEMTIGIGEAAAFLSITCDTLYNMASRGDVPAAKICGSWRFLRSRLALWVERQIDEQTAARQSKENAGKDNWARM